MINLQNYPTTTNGRCCFDVRWQPELTNYECAKEWFRYDTENHPNAMKWEQLKDNDRDRYINSVVRLRKMYETDK